MRKKNMFLWRRIKTENEKIFFAVEKKNREGKGGKYLEKENILSEEEKKTGEGKGGKYLEKENIWSLEEKKNGEGKGGNILEMENVKIADGRTVRLRQTLWR